MWSYQDIFKSIRQENNLENHFYTNPFYYVIFLSLNTLKKTKYRIEF